MNLQLDIEILASLLLGLGVAQLVPMLAALAAGEPVIPYLASAAPALVFGAPLVLSSRSRDRRMRARDGFVVVSGAWIMVSIFGALPYVLTGTLGPVDAIFESVSGFTTTGSTVFSDVEVLPHGVLLWRSLSQWLGGMGIIVLVVAVLPLLGIGGMQLFQAEVPGPEAGKLTPRIADTARRLYLVYAGLTAIAGIGFWFAGMPLFDALCHALTAVSTGGFSTRNASIAAFGSPCLEWIVIAVMVLAGMNFVLHYRVLSGRAAGVVKDEELRLYAGMLVGASVVLALLIAAGDQQAPVRAAVFQVVTLATTTGYASADYLLWPSLAQFVVLNLLVVGGMAGSTSGGIKSLRLLIGWRAFARTVRLLPHRHGLQSVHYGGRAVPEAVVSGILAFLIAYFVLALAASATVAASGYDVETAITAGLTAIGNVGPGLGRIGPSENFGHFPDGVKMVLCFCMLAGRLEIFTLLALFAPAFWRR